MNYQSIFAEVNHPIFKIVKDEKLNYLTIETCKNKNIRTALIPYGVEGISSGAFADCSYLEKIILPTKLLSRPYFLLDNASIISCNRLTHFESSIPIMINEGFEISEFTNLKKLILHQDKWYGGRYPIDCAVDSFDCLEEIVVGMHIKLSSADPYSNSNHSVSECKNLKKLVIEEKQGAKKLNFKGLNNLINLEEFWYYNKDISDIHEDFIYNCPNLTVYGRSDELKKYCENKGIPYISINSNINEQIINEKKRLQFISTSRKAQKYKGQKIGRWEAKNNSKIANTVKDYNKIDMNTFWKKDILKFEIKVKGETDDYVVKVEFNNILEKLKTKVRENRNLLELKLIYKSLVEALNSSDVKVWCSCPDFQYRFSYWLTQQGDNAGEDENREAAITNPNNNLGAGCKHILAVLNNAEWLHKIASVINNYVAYCQDKLENLYSKFIFPKIYDMSYEKAEEIVQDFDNTEEQNLASDEATLNLANALGRIRGRIQKGSNKNPIAQKRKAQLNTQKEK